MTEIFLVNIWHLGLTYNYIPVYVVKSIAMVYDILSWDNLT